MITALIVNFLRPEYTKECVKSLAESYPQVKILVAENGECDDDLEKFVREHGADYLETTGYNPGVGFARNGLMSHVMTDYVLIGDNDFYYDNRAGLERMEKFLDENGEYSAIGGRIEESGRTLNYQGTMEFGEKYIRYHAMEAKEITECDITYNFLIARKNDIIKWDEELKVGLEHSDWFIRMKKAGKKIAFDPDSIVIHKPSHIRIKESERYDEARNQKNDINIFFKKHRIEKLIAFNVTVNI